MARGGFSKSSDGSWKVRGTTIGRLWAAELKKNPALLRKWKATAKERRTHEHMNRFRAEWARGMHGKLKTKRLETTYSGESGWAKGEYMGFNMLVKAQGSGPTGFLAAQNYRCEAVWQTQQGNQHQGRPWLVYDSCTRRTEVLFVRKGFDKSFGKRKELQKWQRSDGLAQEDEEGPKEPENTPPKNDPGKKNAVTDKKRIPHRTAAPTTRRAPTAPTAPTATSARKTPRARAATARATILRTRTTGRIKKQRSGRNTS